MLADFHAVLMERGELSRADRAALARSQFGAKRCILPVVGVSTMAERPPRNEPEVMRANGHAYATSCNVAVSQPYQNVFLYIALELAEQAYEVHGLHYVVGLNAMDKYPPDRFTWLCDENGDAKKCVKLRDDHTGRVMTWPHWRG